MLRRKMPEPFVRSISRKRLTQRRLLIVCMTYAMGVMNLSPKVRQHSFRKGIQRLVRLHPGQTVRADAKKCKNASVFCFAAELLQSDLCSTAIQCISRKALMVLFVGRTSHDPQVRAAQKNTTQVEAPEM